MKNSFAITAFAAVCCISLVMCGNINRRDRSNNDLSGQYPVQMITSVPVPDEVEFAGERLSLSRYDLTERYDREINAFAYTHSNTMMLIKRANRFFPLIEPILARNGVPDDLKYLCVIESSLNPRAVSAAGAAGLWQFMKGTAPGFGLEVSDDVDERYSIEASTEAACKYLKQAYEKYGDWASAAMSYNGGQGRITRELEAQQVDSALDLLLVEETSRYYFRMVAIKHIFESPQRYGFFLLAGQLYKPMEFKRIEVSETIGDLTAFAKSHGLTYAQLKDFNGWLRSNTLPIKAGSAKRYTILIPTQESLYYSSDKKPAVHNSGWVVERLPQDLPL